MAPTLIDKKETDPVLKALAAGHAAVMVCGNIHDLVVQDGAVCCGPQRLVEHLDAQGYRVLRYSKANGARIHQYASLTPKEKHEIDGRLNAVGLGSIVNRDGQNNADEVRVFFRGIARLMQVPCAANKPLALVIEYAENVAPAVSTAAAGSDEQVIVAETLHTLANAPALAKSGNVLICIMVRDGFQSSLLNDLHRVEIPYPSESKALEFLNLRLTLNAPKGGSRHSELEPGFTEAECARLVRGLRLRDTEAMLREARNTGAPLTRQRVLDAKAASVLRISEGTLSVMTTELQLEDIIGLSVVKRFFTRVAEKLKAGDPTSPRAVLMAGPPGTAKSSFAAILASLCRFNIVRFDNVKNMFVGESERRLNLALRLVEQLAPVILFIDEISESTPNRNTSSTDGGVSLDLLAKLFSFSARDDLRGKVLLLAASNVPERLDPAWHDRFVCIPFLELTPDELCQLFPALERRMTGQATLNPADPDIVEACRILHAKGASPRKALDILNHAMLCSDGNVTPGDILTAARDFVGSTNPIAVAYCSLVSVSLASFQSYQPWSVDPKAYAYPWYLEQLVDKATGEINREELMRRIAEYQRAANL